jgi:hypothetical protein
LPLEGHSGSDECLEEADAEDALLLCSMVLCCGDGTVERKKTRGCGKKEEGGSM